MNRITLRGIIASERITGKPFSEFDTSIDSPDIVILAYAMYAVYASSPCTIDVYTDRMDITSNAYDNIFKQLLFISSIMPKNDTPEDSDSDGETLTMSRLAAFLIVSCGLDPHYVMDEMQLYEIKPIIDQIVVKRREQQEDKRFWTFQVVAPHIDAKKSGINSLHDYLPFPWEEDRTDDLSDEEVDKIFNALEKWQN